MPSLQITYDDGRFRWDAYSTLISTIMVPDQQALRREYESALKLQMAKGLPDVERLLTKNDRVLAKAFDRRPRLRKLMATRQLHSKLAGAVLWDLHTATASHPEIATKNKIEFTIDRISVAAGKAGARASLRQVWRQFRPVIHWCAALAYHGQVFGRPFPADPSIGYGADAVLSDFLTLGSTFLTFARKVVEFPEGASASFWTAPVSTPVEPRQPEWPDAHVIASGITLDPEFLKTAAGYVDEKIGIVRDPIARRFDRH